MKASHLLLFFTLLISSFKGLSQDERLKDAFPEINKSLDYRCIGPFRGGRSAAVAGVKNEPMLYYMGSTGGGIWKTDNGGSSWKNISDGYFGGSIGSIAVSESQTNVIYVGTGEVTVRGNVSSGTGIYKSIDGGRSWNHVGLPNSRHIPRLRIHPRNPDIAYAAVLGDLYKSTEERGVYKTIDGGKSWKRILFANHDAGVVDLILDPVNPEVLYASTWRVRRTPWDFSSGGDGSGLWKSKDGGTTWVEISKNKGFPEGILGIIGVSVSPVNPDRIWTIVENEDGGVYLSDDAGKTWERTNENRNLRQRAWYYSRIYADTKNADKVYVVNVAYHTSTDGGKTFKGRYAPHGDHHDLWIAPEDDSRMIIADDGGAQITYNGGDHWSTYENQPTSQFYRVTTDDHFPYRIYGAQQDNSAIRIQSRAANGAITANHWESTAGGECAHLAPDPEDNDIVYGGNYGGYLTRRNHHTNMNRAVNVWPDNPMGSGVEAMKYRFQWNFPLFFSPHNSNKLYTCSQNLHVSLNGGETWKTISPDLTRNDPEKQVSSGGPITKDNTGVEYYATIFAAIESPYEKDLFWCGSDDGLIHISKDGGENWNNVTPKNLPAWALINSIEADPWNNGGLYVAATLYKLGNYTPYLYHTKDYGKTWTLITNGINQEHFTRVIRADKKVKDLLYCGTEQGMYISINNGKNWKPFQLNLPIVPITDIALKDNDLIVATQGRSFWIFDDLNLIWDEIKQPTIKNELRIYSSQPTVGYGGGGKTSLTQGTNHPSGIRLFLNIPDTAKKVELKILDANNEEIRTFSSFAKNKEDQFDFESGMNIFDWDMYYPKSDDFEGLLMWWGSLNGPKAPPGVYTVQLKVENDSIVSEFEILLDPRIEGSAEDRKAQFNFLLEVRNKLDETHDAIRQMRNLKAQIAALNGRIDTEDFSEVIDEGVRLDSLMTEIEKILYQTEAKSGQDLLNFPIKLNNKLAHISALASMGIYRPTDAMINVKAVLTTTINIELEKWYAIRDLELPKYNELIRTKKVNTIEVSE